MKVPEALSGVVLAVFGLDDRRMARRTSGGSGGPITPPLVAQLYGLPPIPASMASETVGIFEFGGGYVVDSVRQADRCRCVRRGPGTAGS